MKKLFIAAALVASFSAGAADNSKALNDLETAHQAKDWATVMAIYRAHRSTPELKTWFYRKAESGHPMYLLEKANEELGSGKMKQATKTALKGYLAMSADMSICMNPQAKQLAIQHMSSYRDLNMYFNKNQDATLKVINEVVKGEKNSDEKKPDYDDTWVCSLVTPAGELLPEAKRPQMRKMAILTYLITTKTAIELTNALMDQEK